MKYILLSILLALISSCTSKLFSVKQSIPKGNNFYTFAHDGNGTDFIKIYTTTETEIANSVKESNGRVTLSVKNKCLQPIAVIPYVPQGSEFTGTTTFFDGRDSFAIPLSTFGYPTDAMQFSYLERRPVLQSLLIPLKFRPKLDAQTYKDTFLLTTETNLTLSIAAGLKWTKYSYVRDKNYLDSYFNKSTTSAGLFVGFSAVELSKSTTRDPAYLFTRKAPTISPGAYCTFGFNTIFLGVSGGFDFATGPYSGQWIYQGKPWVGIVFGFDVIK